ncbi:MAG TPA: hypothetical protein VF595_18215 [Tepidisphaeraceae bacterium]
MLWIIRGVRTCRWSIRMENDCDKLMLLEDLRSSESVNGVCQQKRYHGVRTTATMNPGGA